MTEEQLMRYPKGVLAQWIANHTLFKPRVPDLERLAEMYRVRRLTTKLERVNEMMKKAGEAGDGFLFVRLCRRWEEIMVERDCLVARLYGL